MKLKKWANYYIIVLVLHICKNSAQQFITYITLTAKSGISVVKIPTGRWGFPALNGAGSHSPLLYFPGGRVAES
jgi:hypothetical protein